MLGRSLPNSVDTPRTPGRTRRTLGRKEALARDSHERSERRQGLSPGNSPPQWLSLGCLSPDLASRSSPCGALTPNGVLQLFPFLSRWRTGREPLFNGPAVPPHRPAEPDRRRHLLSRVKPPDRGPAYAEKLGELDHGQRAGLDCLCRRLLVWGHDACPRLRDVVLLYAVVRTISPKKITSRV